MKKKSLLLLFLSIIIIIELQAIIFESDDATDILKHIDKTSLVIFDLDDTLIKTPSILGNDSWFCYQVKQLTQNGMTFNEAVENVLPLFYLIHYFIQLEVTDEKMPELISNLKMQNIKIIALTARSIGLEKKTKKELRRLGFYFSVNSICDYDINLGITHAGKYTDGIIFSANNDKGEILFQLFDLLDNYPKKIIFIDDKLKYLQSVEKIAESRGIQFIGMRYSGSDEIKKQFDPKTADNELNLFKIKLGLAPLLKKGESCEQSKHNNNSTKS